MCRKGESVEDSVTTLAGYTDVVVLRHPGQVTGAGVMGGHMVRGLCVPLVWSCYHVVIW